MPQHKVVFIFNQNRSGWTETWYKNASQLKDVRVPAAQLAAARSQLLGKGTELEAIRISTVDKPIKHWLQPFKAADSSFGSETDQAAACVLARVHDADLIYSRLVTLRGCPDLDIVFDENGKPKAFPDFFVADFNFFVNQLKALGFTWKARGKTGAGGTIIPVTEALILGSGRIQFTIAGLASNVGESFSLSGFTGPGSNLCNGTHQVRAKDGNNVETNTVAPAGATFAGLQLGTARAITTDYPVPDSGVLLRPGKRDTGRAFFVSRGRRSAR